MTEHVKTAPSVSVRYAATGASKKSNELGMRPMQERAYLKRGEQYLLIKSPPASGKSRALMFIALDKLENQGLKQAIIVVPERAIGASFNDTPLSRYGFWADWNVAPQWNLCNAPGADDPKVAKGIYHLAMERGWTRRTGKVLNDDRADWREAWALFPGDVAYVWHGALHAATVAESLEVAGFNVRSQIIWAKDRLVLSRGDYHWQHEPCWYAVKKTGMQTDTLGIGLAFARNQLVQRLCERACRK